MKYRKDGIRDSQGHLTQRRGKLIVWNVGCRERMKTPTVGAPVRAASGAKLAELANVGV
jgi:hypothetical protein